MEVLYRCPSCKRLIEVSAARVGELQVYLRCAECGEEAALDIASGDARIAVKKADLAKALAPAEKPAEPPAASAAAGDLAPLRAALDALAVPEGAESVAVGFDRLLSRWDDEAEHEKMVKATAISGHLASLGQRYRVVLEHRPGDPRAVRAQEKIIGAAMATMSPGSFTMQKESGERGNARLVILSLIAMAGVGGLLYFWLRYLGGM